MNKDNYKWNWTVDQRAIVESGLKIDIIDFSILVMLNHFATSPSCKRMTQDGELYFLFRWSLIKQQLPILNLNTRQSVKRRIDKLVAQNLIVPHKDNQHNRASWFKFGENRDVLFNNNHQKGGQTVTEKLQILPDTPKNSQQIVTHTVTNGLHSDNKELQNCQQSFTHTDNNGLHYTLDNNTIDNNTYIAHEIEGIKTNIPPSWSKDVKLAVAKYLEYRQDLPSGGHIKTQKGWNAKIKRFTKILAKYDEKILIAAIDLSIEKEWKDVKIEWLFKEHPNMRSTPPPPQQEPDGFKLSEKLEQGYQKRVMDLHRKTNGRISYFTRQQFASWLKGGVNFEKWRDRGLLETEITKKISRTIEYLSTNTFAQQLRGDLSDYVESAFKGNIKAIS